MLTYINLNHTVFPRAYVFDGKKLSFIQKLLADNWLFSLVMLYIKLKITIIFGLCLNDLQCYFGSK